MQTAISEHTGEGTGSAPETHPPSSMHAAVYVGRQTVEIRQVPVPAIGDGEVLLRVEACGVCHTDLKKIEYDLLPAPRIFGHETAGVIVETGRDVKQFRAGDRVVAFHHIPCRKCFYCQRKLYAQCPVYKKVGITAGFEPAGGGFAQYVRVMNWIVESGLERIPTGVSFERASLVEPLNTCLKAVSQMHAVPGETALVLGQGPIGLMFTMLLHRLGVKVIATDTMETRLALAKTAGAVQVFNPLLAEDLSADVRLLSETRGADLAIVATTAPGLIDQAVRCTRPGARVLLFSQTSGKERIDVSGADICVGERTLLGSYSASVDLQKESADLVFGNELPLERLLSHRFGLGQFSEAIALAQRPNATSLKIIVQPQRWS